MTPAYLLEKEGLLALARQVGPDTLFAFDLDGTLAPIVVDYGGVQVAEPVRKALKRLIELAKVCVLTGRSRQDAQEILYLEPHLLIGNHGAEWPPVFKNRDWLQIGLCAGWRDRLSDMLHDLDGVQIEFKGESLTLHYRKSLNRDVALARINAAIEKLEPAPRIIGGKFVVNLLPMEAFNKGDALVAVMDRLGLKRAIYFGDDVTDEEVFRLKNIDLLSIHVGKNDLTAAPYYLSNQAEMLGVLNALVGMLESVPNEEKQLYSGSGN